MPLTARRPSRTAVLTAVARALHREEPPPWVLDDPLALGLAGDDASDVIRRLRAELSPEALLTFTRWVCVLARLPEDIVETAAADGVEQYVILGASHPRLLPWAKRRSLRGSPAPDHGHGGREAHLGVGSEVARPAHAVTLSP